MGLTKQYLRFLPGGICNIIGSASSSICHVDEKTCLVGACENVYLWDVKLNEKLAIYPGSNSLVTCLNCAPDRLSIFSVGYADGLINVFDLKKENHQAKLAFSGHKSAVSCLDFSPDGLLLASGGKDCAVIIWDVVNEAGLYKMTGHQSPITQCRFVRNATVLVTSSKDSTLKFWDLSSQHCVFTLADHRNEIWDFVFLRQESQLVTGSVENELKIYDVTWLQNNEEEDENQTNLDEKRPNIDGDDENLDEQANTLVRLKKFGSILRQSKGRVIQLTSSCDEKLLICLGTKSLIDVYRVLTENESREKVKKKMRKLAKKAITSTEKQELGVNSVVKDCRTRFITLQPFKSTSHPKFIDICRTMTSHNEYRLAMLTGQNSIDYYTLATQSDTGKNNISVTSSLARQVTSSGHRNDVRVVRFSRDATAWASGSRDAVKVWNRASMTCVRTLTLTAPSVVNKSGCACTCITFMLGDRHCVFGDEAGRLHLYDISTNQLIESIDAHEKSINGLHFTPDDKSLVTVSADKTAKFWDFELVTNGDKKKLSMTHNRTLQTNEEILCCKVTDNGKFLAIGLLDNTAKVYFYDSLKFFLSLYGHSLPVLCLDTSSDSTLIVTGSADKNVKIWGMDFGDCHKSLFAHDDSVTSVKFVPKTHLFFTTGKDGKIKQWDGDKFERIQVLTGHHSEIWAMDLSLNGKFLVTSSNDRSIRLWEKSEEILVVQEEQEMERETEYEKSLEQQDDVVPGEATNAEAGLASKKTVETVRSAENIIEALDITEKSDASDLSHPLIKYYGSSTLSAFVVDVIKRIKSSDLEKCLIMVPYGYVISLLSHLCDCIEKNRHVELACRCVVFLIKIHQGVLMTSDLAIPILDRLKNICSPKVSEIRDLIGFNIAALKFLQLELAEKKQIRLFQEAKQQIRQKSAKKRQKEHVFVMT